MVGIRINYNDVRIQAPYSSPSTVNFRNPPPMPETTKGQGQPRLCKAVNEIRGGYPHQTSLHMKCRGPLQTTRPCKHPAVLWESMFIMIHLGQGERTSVGGNLHWGTGANSLEDHNLANASLLSRLVWFLSRGHPVENRTGLASG